MNLKELAKKLNGRQRHSEVTGGEGKEFNLDGVVALYGSSDDLMEFDGAIFDEVPCYEGGIAYLDEDGIIKNDCEDPKCPYFLEKSLTAKTIKAVWCSGEEYLWTYETEIPHETFDILEGDEKYCRGIAFFIDDLKTPEVPK